VLAALLEGEWVGQAATLDLEGTLRL
jgi:hypothetical protein